MESKFKLGEKVFAIGTFLSHYGSHNKNSVSVYYDEVTRISFERNGRILYMVGECQEYFNQNDITVDRDSVGHLINKIQIDEASRKIKNEEANKE